MAAASLNAQIPGYKDAYQCTEVDIRRDLRLRFAERTLRLRESK
jgi:hypothetical protein